MSRTQYEHEIVPSFGKISPGEVGYGVKGVDGLGGPHRD